MAARGDKEQDIAAWFGENQGRVAEAKAGSHGSIAPAPAIKLPPKGPPGLKGRRLYAYAKDALKALREQGTAGIDKAIKELEEGIARFDEHES